MNHNPSPRRAILVIGYGNALRGDDAVGPRAASAVAELGWPGVIAKEVTQLTPELAEPLASARLAIFVDARPANGEECVAVRPIEPADPGSVLAHVADPRHLLALARTAYGTCPRRGWSRCRPSTSAWADGYRPRPSGARRGPSD
jgi:hydrogenase maturation protease